MFTCWKIETMFHAHKTTKTAAFSFYTFFYLIQSHQFNDIKFVIYTAFEKKWFISTL